MLLKQAVEISSPGKNGTMHRNVQRTWEPSKALHSLFPDGAEKKTCVMGAAHYLQGVSAG